MAVTQYLGIRFPFTAKDRQNFYVDLDSNPYLQIKNDLAHLIFTPIGSRVRMPNFGCDLVKLLFNPSDDKTNTDIKTMIQDAVGKFIPKVTITDISTEPSNTNAHLTTVKIGFKIDEGTFEVQDVLEVNM